MTYRFALAASILLVLPVTAQRGQRGQNQTTPPTIQAKTDGMQKFEGFIDFFWDAQAERLFLEIAEWEKEFLYVMSTPSNVAGSNRASWNGTRLVKFSREGSKIFLIQPNYQYRAISDDPLERRAVDEAYTDANIAGFTIAAEEDGRVLVDATDFLMRDSGGGGGRGRGGAAAGGGGGRGALDRSRSAFYWPRTKNFPMNTEIELTLTFSGGNGTTIRQHHSMVELPNDGYEPRKYDSRSGVSSFSYVDYATPIKEPLRKQFTSRHRLQKKDPNAAISEAVEPIVYYIDPGAPEPIRSALLEGASWWNQAFEAIGYKDAFQVKVLPGDVDPMDLRYNIVFWIHRPNRGWSSGSSVRDPRTGEIITGRVYLGSQRVRQDFLIGSGLVAPYAGEEAETQAIEEMVLARTRQLGAHEVGHTLGFGHNFAASTQDGLRESVMDYPHPTVKIRDDDTLDLSDTYDVGIGEWDKISVAYAYSDFPDGTDESVALDGVLARAHQRGLFYLGTVGAGSASPLTHQWDNGPDALEEFNRVMRIREIALANFSEANIRRGSPMSTLEEVLVPAYMYHRYQTEAVSKSLGGVDYRIAMRGDGQLVTATVTPERQRQALGMLLRTIEPETLALPKRIVALIPPRSGGRGGGAEVFPRRTSPTFDPIAVAETAANHSVGFILNASRGARLVAQHSMDPRNPSLTEVIDQLLQHTWRSQRNGSPYHAEVGRAVDSVVLYHLMALASNTNAPTQVRAIASLEIEELRRWLESRTSDDSQSPLEQQQRAHFHFASMQIEHYQADPTKFNVTQPSTAPPGAPIGMGQDPLPGMVLPDMVCDWK